MDIGKAAMSWMLAVSASRLMHDGGAAMEVRGAAMVVGVGLGVDIGQCIVEDEVCCIS